MEPKKRLRKAAPRHTLAESDGEGSPEEDAARPRPAQKRRGAAAPSAPPPPKAHTKKARLLRSTSEL